MNPIWVSGGDRAGNLNNVNNSNNLNDLNNLDPEEGVREGPGRQNLHNLNNLNIGGPEIFKLFRLFEFPARPLPSGLLRI